MPFARSPKPRSSKLGHQGRGLSTLSLLLSREQTGVDRSTDIGNTLCWQCLFGHLTLAKFLFSLDFFLLLSLSLSFVSRWLESSCLGIASSPKHQLRKKSVVSSSTISPTHPLSPVTIPIPGIVGGSLLNHVGK